MHDKQSYRNEKENKTKIITVRAKFKNHSCGM